MYTIIMKPNKELVASNVAKVFQRENAVDKIQILLPEFYEDLDIKSSLVTLKYVDQTRTAHSESLVLDEELYKDTYLRYTLPITTELTKYAGDITIWISIVKVDLDNMLQYVLHSGEYTITVSPLADLYTMVADDTLDAIDQRMAELSAKLAATDILADEFAKNQVDDLEISEDGLLQVTANSTPKGKGVYVLRPIEDPDNVITDGVIDLDDIKNPEDAPTPPIEEDEEPVVEEEDGE